MTFWETIQRGEYVMFALAALFIICICIWSARSVSLSRCNKSYNNLLLQVRDHVSENDIENALKICECAETSGSRIIRAGLSHLGRPIPELKSAMRDTADVEKERLGAGAIWLKTIAVVSPLLGLGGTLTGIIDILRDLGESPETVDIAGVCMAISPAIVTTVVGLGVGIFALLSQTCLNSQIETSLRKMDELSLEFANMLNEPS